MEFKLALGIGPQRFIMQRRVQRAKTLMSRTNQPLAWVAQEAAALRRERRREFAPDSPLEGTGFELPLRERTAGMPEE